MTIVGTRRDDHTLYRRRHPELVSGSIPRHARSNGWDALPCRKRCHADNTAPDRRSSSRAARWMLKQVQHDVGLDGPGGFRGTVELKTKPCSPRHPELVSGSIYPHARSYRFKAQLHRKVAPFRVRAVDKVDLPVAVPAFQLLLSENGALHVTEHFIVNEAIDLVTRSEAACAAIPVLAEPPHEVGRHTNVYCTVVPAGENIDARVPLIRHGSDHAARWMLKQVQHDEVFGGRHVSK
jgi:hypothetical protein